MIFSAYKNPIKELTTMKKSRLALVDIPTKRSDEKKPNPEELEPRAPSVPPRPRRREGDALLRILDDLIARDKARGLS